MTRQRKPSDRLGPEEYERLASTAARDLAPDIDVEAMALGFNMIRMANRIMRDLEVSVHRPMGMSFAAYRVLFAIRSAGRIVPNELARLSSVSTASMSSMLSTLERGGLITREHDPEDGRRFVVGLTDEGEGVLGELLTANNEREQEWAEGLTPGERIVLVELLRKWLLFRPAPVGSGGEEILTRPGSAARSLP